MKKRVKIAVSLALAVLMLLPVMSTAITASAAGLLVYEITNPYDGVDFDTWNAYKAQLHVHTDASDGDVPVQTVVEEHYRLGYDILAITDHMTPNHGWDIAAPAAPIMRLIKYERTKMAPIIPVTAKRYAEITNGVGRDGRPMLDVPFGCEQNGAVPSNSHLNSFFVNYGQGMIGVDNDFETPVKAIKELGGNTFLNHVSEATGAEKNPAVYERENVINKFANLYLKYFPSLFAIDVSSGGDGATAIDRTVLYEKLLTKLIPYGVAPHLVTFSDAHQMGQWDRAFTIHMMKESLEADNKDAAVADLKRSMEDGTYFGISRSCRGGELPDDFVSDGITHPMVEDIIIGLNTITIIPNGDTDGIAWVTNGGKVINEGEYTIDLAQFADDIESYVRPYLTGPGGICYVQPFVTVPEGTTLKQGDLTYISDYSVYLRLFVDFLDKYFFQYNPLVKLFKQYVLGIN
ncbi:MAG: hypothetical protein FWF08_10255 [Oscillospiraceae bacterium]|nr:hypothetical protein [Oscillospiraceae bacterium]